MENKNIIPKFFYYVNLDERGEFNADVRNLLERSVFEITTIGIHELIEDGFLKHKDDLIGLLTHLKSLEIVPKNAVLKRGN
jgi:EAL domain-containing protein (putative c-di-GMP-specific phosphodiesterase class I)